MISHAQDHEKLTLAVYPSKSNENLYMQYKPLISYLKKNLNKEINFIIAKSYKDEIKLLNSNKVDIAILGPYNYIKAQNVNPKIQYLVTKQNIVGDSLVSTYQSVIVTLKKSNISSIKELKNRSFGFTDFNSTSGYLFPTLVLKEKNITKESLKQIFMLKKHSRVMEALTQNSIDAGATYHENYQDYQKKYGDIYKILYKSAPIPYDVMVASPYLKKNTAQKIIDVLLKYKEEKNGRVFNLFIKKDKSNYEYLKNKAQMIQ